MPQLRVANTDDQIHDEEGKEKTFDHQEVSAAGLPFLAQFIALVVGEQCANKNDQTKDNRNCETRIGNPDRATHPGEIAKQDQTQRAAERIAFIRQPGHCQPRQRIDRHAKEKYEEIPDDQSHPRITILNPIIVKQSRPCAAGTLLP